MAEGSQVGGWVSALPFEIPLDVEELIANPLEPPEEVQEGEEVVGDFTEDEKLAWTLLHRLCEVGERAALDRTYARADEERSSAKARANEFGEKAEVIKNIFWTMIRGNRGLWAAERDIAVRKGFKVVTYEARENPLLKALLDLRRHPD